MKFLESVLAAVMASGVAALPSMYPPTSSNDLGPFVKRQNTPNGEGMHNGYFYSWWSDGASPATYTNGEGGSYSVSWQSGGNLVGGKGWNPGSARSITYSANWTPVNNGNSYLTLYGWTRNPLVEYYIVEAHGDYNPGSAGEMKGEVTSDGSTYKLYQSTRVNAPSIDGTQTFNQYWAIRDQHRTEGTIDAGVFFDAWAAAGMQLGTHYYQILATEAYQSAGESKVTISSPA
jgi:endo-1,4-beta-xylanase